MSGSRNCHPLQTRVHLLFPGGQHALVGVRDEPSRMEATFSAAVIGLVPGHVLGPWRIAEQTVASSNVPQPRYRGRERISHGQQHGQRLEKPMPIQKGENGVMSLRVYVYFFHVRA